MQVILGAIWWTTCHGHLYYNFEGLGLNCLLNKSQWIQSVSIMATVLLLLRNSMATCFLYNIMCPSSCGVASPSPKFLEMRENVETTCFNYIWCCWVENIKSWCNFLSHNLDQKFLVRVLTSKFLKLQSVNASIQIFNWKSI